jgi:mannosylfructose-6-phosphate phosphatase
MTEIRLVCSDLDGTLVGSAEALTRFRTAWDDLREERRPVLYYDTGRLINDVLSLIAEPGMAPVLRR